MRIAIVSETWLPHVDGVVTRLRHTVPDLVARGHDVLVVAPSCGEPMRRVTQVRSWGAVVPLIDRSRRWGAPDPRLRRIVGRFAPAVVHVVNPVLMGAFAVRDLRPAYPVVASLHTDLVAYAGRYGLGFTRPVLTGLNRVAYRHADLGLATSPTGLALLRGLGDGPAEIWPPGVDDGLFTLRPGGDAESEASGRAVRVVCVGRLAREKGYDVLRPVLAATRRDGGPAVELTFVGDGPDRTRLEHVFAGTPTTFVGRLDGSDLAAAYHRADVVAFTSTTDTVGLVLLEAAATGRPVVALDTPAARDTLSGYGRAVLVPQDAEPQAWLAAFDTARSTPAADPGTRPGTWGHATDVLLDAYARAVEHRSARLDCRSLATAGR